MITPTQVQIFYGRKYCEFLSLFPETPIQETENYYFKKVDMFGEKELRLFKKTKRITISKI